MGVQVWLRRVMAAIGLVVAGLAAMLATGIGLGKADAAPRDSGLCPPPPILNGVITAVPVPITGLTCLLGAADIEIVTTYKRPDNTLVTKRFRTLVAVPTLVNADDDILPDVVVTTLVLSTKNFRVTIDRAALEVATLPLAVDLIINDPTGGALPRERIHGGYDNLQSAAPNKFKTDINLGEQPNGDTKVNLVTTVTPKTAGQSNTLIGGLFDGDAMARQNPLGGTGRYTPAPTMSSLTLSMGKQYKIEMTASAPTTLDATVELVDGTTATEQRGTAYVDKLPSSVTVDYIPGATKDQRTITYVASGVVTNMDLAYRETKSGTQTLGAVVHAKDVPTNVTVKQTGPKAGSIDASPTAFKSLEVGLANGEPVLNQGSTGPYVNIVSSGAPQSGGGWAFNSVAARIDYLKRATINALGTIRADVEVTPDGHLPVALHVEHPGFILNGTVLKLPQHLTLSANFTDVPIPSNGTTQETVPGMFLDYDGHGQGLDEVRIEAVQAEPFFGRADRIDARATGLKPAFLFKAIPIHDEPVPHLVVATGIDVTSSQPIETVEFQATSDHLSSLPAGTGAVYIDTPARYAVGARVHDFEQVRTLNNHISDSTTLETILRHEPFSIHAELDDPEVDGDQMTADGLVTNLPHHMELRLKTPEKDGTPGYVDFDGNGEGIDEIRVTLEKETAFVNRNEDLGPGDPVKAEPHEMQATIAGVPSELRADIEASPKGATIELSRPIEQVDVLLTTGPGADLSVIGNDAGVAATLTDDEFVVFGRLRQITLLRYLAPPLMEVEVHSAGPQTFRLDLEVDRSDDDLDPGSITGVVQQVPSEVLLQETLTGYLWTANTGIAHVDLHGRSMPTGADGKAFDGGLHSLDVDIDQLPARFRIDIDDAVKGVEALGVDGNGVQAEFGTVFVHVSDNPYQGSSEDPDGATNLAQVFSLHSNGHVTHTTLRLHELVKAFYRLEDTALAEDATKAVEIEFGTDDPALFDLSFDTYALDANSSFEPPRRFEAAITTPDDDDNTDDEEMRLAYEASGAIGVLPLHLTSKGAIGADLRFTDVPTAFDVCFTAGHSGMCDQQMPLDILATTSPYGTYRVPHVVTAAIHTDAPAKRPLKVDGALCLRPPSKDEFWDPVCDYDFGAVGSDTGDAAEYGTEFWFDDVNTESWVAFHHVQLRSVRAEIYMGDTPEIVDYDDLSHGVQDPVPLEDDLVGFYLDTRVDPDDPDSPLSEVLTGLHGIAYHSINPCYDPKDPFWDDFDPDDEDVPLTTIESHMPGGCDIQTVLKGNGHFDDPDPTNVELEVLAGDGNTGLKARHWKHLRDGESEIYDDANDPDEATNFLDCGTDHAIRMRVPILRALLIALTANPFATAWPSVPIDITDLGFVC